MSFFVGPLGSSLASQTIWRDWGAGPVELALILAPAAWYAAGLRALWRSAGTGRGVTPLRATAFFAGIFTLFIALASPLDAVAEMLFSAHMVQHLLLILVAAPLCVLGAPMLPMLWAMPRRTRRKAAAWWRGHRNVRRLVFVATTPGVVFALHTIAIWYWHFPAPYQLALRDPFVHALEHLSFFGTALLFWWIVIQPVGRRRMGYGAGLLLIGGTLMQSGALGAVLMFAREPWYPAHIAGATAWHITLLEDQQLAGLIMWIPAGMVYIAAAALLFMQWMRSDEQQHAAVPTRAPVSARDRRPGGRVTVVASRALIVAAVCAASVVTSCARSSSVPDRYVEGGDAGRGRTAITAYGCGSCHMIPGVTDARGMVGPPLEHWAQRRIIAGEVPNDPARLITWLTVPQSIEPGTAMPNMGVTDGEARDMAAYLYSLH